MTQNLHTQHIESCVDKGSVDCIDVIKQTVTIPEINQFTGEQLQHNLPWINKSFIERATNMSKNDDLDFALSSDLFIIYEIK